MSQAWEVGPHRAQLDRSILGFDLDGEVTVPHTAKLMEMLFTIDAAQDRLGLLLLTKSKLAISAEAPTATACTLRRCTSPLVTG